MCPCVIQIRVELKSVHDYGSTLCESESNHCEEIRFIKEMHFKKGAGAQRAIEPGRCALPLLGV